jgi:hypothetical protein
MEEIVKGVDDALATSSPLLQARPPPPAVHPHGGFSEENEGWAPPGAVQSARGSWA